MLITIHFHKALQKFTRVSSHTLEASSYLDLFRACLSLFPDLGRAVQKLGIKPSRREELLFFVNGQLLDAENYIFPPSTKKKIVLAPIIYGSGGGIGQIFLGLALIALTIFTFGAGTVAAATFGAAAGSAGAIAASATVIGGITVGTVINFIIGIGINLILGGLMQLLTPKPKLKQTDSVDGQARANNDSFGGLINTTNSGISVSLNYGLIRVGGQLISGYVKTIEHDKTVTVRVGDYV